MMNLGENEIFIDGPSGKIEAILSMPQMVDPNYCFVMCHPHPLHGGTMNNKIVTQCCRTLFKLGITTLRFNFRGIGKSDGHYAQSEGEIADARAVIEWASLHLQPKHILLGGFSFGSYIAYVSASQRSDCALLICVGPPVEHMSFQQQPIPQCPIIVIQGMQDEVINAQASVDWAKQLPPATTKIHCIETASHFFHSKLIEINDLLSRDISSLFQFHLQHVKV